jgi:hypothetical protein
MRSLSASQTAGNLTISESSALNGDGRRQREREEQTSKLTNGAETLDTEKDDDGDGRSGPGGDGKRVMKAQRMVKQNIYTGPTRTTSTSRKIGNEIRTGRSTACRMESIHYR